MGQFNFKTLITVFSVSATILIGGCGSTGTKSDHQLVGGDNPSVPTMYTIGGTSTNVKGDVVLQNNGGDDLTVHAGDNSFTFATPMREGSGYNVTILSAPTDQDCTLSNASGTVANSDVTDITLTCVDKSYTVGGTLAGLDSGNDVVLQNNGGDNLSLHADGTFTFATALHTGERYNVTVQTQPVGQECSVENGSGTIVSSNVTDIKVTCNDLTSVAQLGYLAGAEVKIYEVASDGTKTLLFTETTSEGDISTSGRFDGHAADLEDGKWYLYEVSGGNDIDADDDGSLDTTPTINRGVVHLFAKGSDIREHGYVRVTMVSDVLYQKFWHEIATNPYAIAESEWQETFAKIIGEDLDGDGAVGWSDVLGFDPVSHKKKMRYAYRLRQAEILGEIHAGNGFYEVGGLFSLGSLGAIDMVSEIGNNHDIRFGRDGSRLYLTGYQGNERGFYILDLEPDASHAATMAEKVIIDEARGFALSSDEKIAYVAAGDGGVKRVDLSVSPAAVGDLNTTLGNARIVAVSPDGTALYVATKEKIFLLDAATGASLGSAPLDENVKQLVPDAETKRLLALSGYASSRLQVYDLSDPANPARSYTPLGLETHRFAYCRDGAKAYIALAGVRESHAAIEIVDLTDPADPQPLGSFASSEMIGSTQPFFSGIAFAPGCNRLYTSGPGDYIARNLTAFDVTDKSAPKVLATYTRRNISYDHIVLSPDGSLIAGINDYHQPSVVAIEDLNKSRILGTNVIRGGIIALKKDESHLYLANYNNFFVYDTSRRPAIDGNETILATLSYGGAYPGAIALSDDESRAYVTTRDNGLVIVDLNETNLHVVAQTGKTALGGEAKALALSEDGKYAYVGTWNHLLKVVKIDDESNVTVVGSLDLENGQCLDMAFDDTRKILHVACAGGGVYVVDLSSPADPVKRSEYTEGASNLKNVALSPDGKTLYVAYNRSTDALVVLDTSDPDAPAVVARSGTDFELKPQETLLSPDGRRLYVADQGYYSGYEAKIVDVEDREHPRLIGRLPHTNRSSNGLALGGDGSRLYVGGGSGVLLLDVRE
ncbi:LVIVD repeat-containing protein [Hydrogenimonas cancrithermarum]|uniref:Uncharacterized protein n=1 Tax=Hydrogenimonas cancrithermarum TaxID=2993563 RepID=A0ABM8FJM7_9BACT|nr:hypothetical protein [Hydrogenimonas cancrithermarum]BDY11839.1 hypothetical protein HCR_01510 [Hydrogenimonas cancrithermarum]